MALNRRTTPILATLGILGFGVASLGTLYGLKVGGVINFALVGSISPIITAVVSILVLKERFNRFYIFSALICLTGLVVLVLGKYQISTANIALTSVMLIFTAYLFEALPFAYSKKFRDRTPLIEYMAITQISAAIFMWFLQLVYFRDFGKLVNVPIEAWLAVVFVSVVACNVCYHLLYWLLKYIEGHNWHYSTVFTLFLQHFLGICFSANCLI